MLLGISGISCDDSALQALTKLKGEALHANAFQRQISISV
jgi:hypothetical protein